ncbi:hypothetical protein F394_gp56 [Aeromonas phage vB_AsaM-56]|uniref:Uncharacterized protein n=1 Tax=Aeromonas phage vB_AsaM-56 TaxID=1127514 RepID=H9C0V6_9CAUD|nr:hypothetical protein F394_gp56 [Aeromonas phage vB_AsaM-56]AFC22652.1 hypothetical protein AsaM-56_0056 [Aeromonas phage vB_AsaM-56]
MGAHLLGEAAVPSALAFDLVNNQLDLLAGTGLVFRHGFPGQVRIRLLEVALNVQAEIVDKGLGCGGRRGGDQRHFAVCVHVAIQAHLQVPEHGLDVRQHFQRGCVGLASNGGPGGAACRLGARGQVGGQGWVVQHAVVLQTSHTEEVGLVLELVQGQHGGDPDTACPVDTGGACTLQPLLAPLGDGLVMEALALREVGVHAGGAGVVVVTICSGLAGGFHNREHGGFGDPVAFLHLGTDCLGCLDRGNQYLDHFRVDVGGQERRDAGVADGYQAGLSVHGKVEIVAQRVIHRHGLLAHEVDTGAALQFFEVDNHGCRSLQGDHSQLVQSTALGDNEIGLDETGDGCASCARLDGAVRQLGEHLIAFHCGGHGSGCPVVACAHDGHREALRHNVAGFGQVDGDQRLLFAVDEAIGLAGASVGHQAGNGVDPGESANGYTGSSGNILALASREGCAGVGSGKITSDGRSLLEVYGSLKTHFLGSLCLAEAAKIELLHGGGGILGNAGRRARGFNVFHCVEHGAQASCRHVFVVVTHLAQGEAVHFLGAVHADHVTDNGANIDLGLLQLAELDAHGVHGGSHLLFDGFRIHAGLGIFGWGHHALDSFQVFRRQLASQEAHQVGFVLAQLAIQLDSFRGLLNTDHGVNDLVGLLSVDLGVHGKQAFQRGSLLKGFLFSLPHQSRQGRVLGDFRGQAAKRNKQGFAQLGHFHGGGFLWFNGVLYERIGVGHVHIWPGAASLHKRQVITFYVSHHAVECLAIWRGAGGHVCGVVVGCGQLDLLLGLDASDCSLIPNAEGGLQIRVAKRNIRSNGSDNAFLFRLLNRHANVLVEDRQVVERAGALGQLFWVAVQPINLVAFQPQLLPVWDFLPEVRADVRLADVGLGNVQAPVSVNAASGLPVKGHQVWIWHRLNHVS